MHHQVTGSLHSGLFFNSGDKSCISDGNIDFDDDCIVGAAYDSFGEWEDYDDVCLTFDTSENALPDGYSWALDILDGVYDNKFVYYNNPSSVGIYVFDTGVRTDHIEFEDLDGISDGNSIASNLLLPLGIEFWDDEFVFPAFHGTSVASAAGGNYYGSSKNQNIYNVNTAGVFNFTFGNYTILFPSTAFTLIGLEAVLNNTRSTGQKGVINFSYI